MSAGPGRQVLRAWCCVIGSAAPGGHSEGFGLVKAAVPLCALGPNASEAELWEGGPCGLRASQKIKQGGPGFRGTELNSTASGQSRSHLVRVWRSCF